MRKTFILCLMGLIVAWAGVTFPQTETVPFPEVPKGWEKVKGGLAPPWVSNPASFAKIWNNPDYRETYLKDPNKIEYIPVRITLKRNVINRDKRLHFYEYDASVVIKGWLNIHGDYSDFHLFAEDKHPNVKIIRQEGWYRKRPKGRKIPIRFDWNAEKVSVEVHHPRHVTVDKYKKKHNVTVVFPQPIRPMYLVKYSKSGMFTPGWLISPAVLKKSVEQGYFTEGLVDLVKPHRSREEVISTTMGIKIEFLGRVEKWEITLDGVTRVTLADSPDFKPKKYYRPKDRQKRDPWKREADDGIDVKYDEVDFGLKVKWSQLIKVEIENNKFKWGDVFHTYLVSTETFCNPPGIYNCQLVKHKIQNPKFKVYKGEKKGNRLTLLVQFLGAKDKDLSDMWVYFRCNLVSPEEIRQDKLPRFVKRKNWKGVVLFPSKITFALREGPPQKIRWNESLGNWDWYTIKVIKIK